MKLRTIISIVCILTISIFLFSGCWPGAEEIEEIADKETTSEEAIDEETVAEASNPATARLENVLTKNTNSKGIYDIQQIFGNNYEEALEILYELPDSEIIDIYNLFKNGKMLSPPEDYLAQMIYEDRSGDASDSIQTDESITLIEVDDSMFPDLVQPGENISLELKITDLANFSISEYFWENDLFGYHIPGELFGITYHWYDTTSDGIVSSDNNIVSIDNIYQGETSEIVLEIKTPPESGIYNLRYALKWGSHYYYLTLADGSNKNYRKIMVGEEKEIITDFFKDKTFDDKIDLLRKYVNNGVLQENPDDGYLTVTNIPMDDPYYKAVDKINTYRNGRIIKFEDSIFEIVEEIKDLDFHYMGILVKPEIINEDFVYDAFKLNRALENDYKKDFTYGFITGINAEDTLNYIDNMIHYEKKEPNDINVFRAFWHTGEGAFGGGYDSWGDQQTSELVDIFSGIGLDSARINTIEDPDFMEEIKRSDILYFNLHGLPWQIELVTGEYFLHGMNIDDSFNAKIVLNAGCHGACTCSYYDQCSVVNMENYQESLRIFPKEEALSLNFLKHGTLAYFGHTAMWGDNSWPVSIFEDLSGTSFKSGDLIDVWYEKYNSPEYNDGRDFNMDRGAGIILFGDPALEFSLQ